MKYKLKVINPEIGGKDKEVVDFNKKLKEEDPIMRNAKKSSTEEEGLSPMDPPDAYDKDRAIGLEYDKLPKKIQELCDEHKEVITKCDAFEKALIEFKEGGFYITKEINDTFNDFFVYFDEHILPHNRKEERELFPILHKKMLESGEHSDGKNPHTPVDLMEDDHVKFIQLATLSFNFLGLAMRIKDAEARVLTFDIAFNNAKELVEALRLHIFREDNTLFPLAQQLLTAEELSLFH